MDLNIKPVCPEQEARLDELQLDLQNVQQTQRDLNDLMEGLSADLKTVEDGTDGLEARIRDMEERLAWAYAGVQQLVKAVEAIARNPSTPHTGARHALIELGISED